MPAGGDLLSILLLRGCRVSRSVDQATVPARPAGMTDEQLRDESLTLFTAGHETTANALSFTWYLLAQNPAGGSRAARGAGRGARRAAGRGARADGRRPGPAAVHAGGAGRVDAALPARLGRRAARPPEPCERRPATTLPAGAIVLMSQWVTHRDPRWWPDPPASTRRGGSRLPRLRRRPPALRLLPLRRRAAELHRRGVRVDRGGDRVSDDRKAVAPAARGRIGFAGTQTATDDHPPPEARRAGGVGAKVGMRRAGAGWHAVNCCRVRTADQSCRSGPRCGP